jgi:tRNA-2-methylthio-N6-dimethylallyladenosine synthase
VSKGFHIITMGCQMNAYDSDLLAQNLIARGLKPVSEPGAADLILINTCTVRAKPEQKALSLLGRMAEIKRKNPRLILGLVGCLAQHRGAEIMERFPDLDMVMGPRELNRFSGLMDRIERYGEKVMAVGLDGAPPDAALSNGYFTGRVGAFLSIMEGCDNFCTYCIVPYVRGREVSRSPREIISEAEHLLSQGVREITLLGQNVNSYRWNEGKPRDFAWLVRQLDELEGLMRLRFTTSHPKDLSDELIACFGDLDTLCPHIHLPFQAGSNAVLKRMKRGYTREAYLERVERLRSVRPDMAISSDVMVGFPGESAEDFEGTLDLVRRVRFDALFSFKYSDRKGTLAEKLDHKVGEREKSLRLTALQSLQKQITLEKNKALEGKVVAVLVEGTSKRGGQCTGRTGTNRVVNFISDKDIIGNIVKVKVEIGLPNSLRGELVLDREPDRPRVLS